MTIYDLFSIQIRNVEYKKKHIYYDQCKGTVMPLKASIVISFTKQLQVEDFLELFRISSVLY